MRRIFKYPIPLADDFTLDLPVAAVVLTVQTQHDRPVLWALIQDELPIVQRGFMLRGTGHDAAGLGAYVGTFQLSSGFVGHLFEAPS